MWERAIPRADRALQENSAVCEKHFDARFIMREFVHIVGGQEVGIPRDVPTLRDDAVPTVFPNLPKYIFKRLPQERKRRAAASVDGVPARKRCKNSTADGRHPDYKRCRHRKCWRRPC
ncbi:hypothetical protein HPB50_001933 [Hyalomma asiaticum]|uniref:Uncharacterized protein n=1 Tax=Hyalomma asiaticum TaxID=266040 RepID=A0ACB7T9F0_HYAAI|nr:hypothetical protein HPB50_001933 [Hyalomma asiaticum]